jgi:Domain of unknown function (DUF5979)/Thioester domain
MHRNNIVSRPRRPAAAIVVVTVLASLTLALAHPTTAFARWRPTAAAITPPGLNTEVTTVTLPGERGLGLVSGAYKGPDGFDPVRDGYPDTIPPGWAALASTADPMYAGTIGVEDRYGNTGLTYCIDLEHDTTDGIHYIAHDWMDAHVPNIGYVEYIITHYYPYEPAMPAVISNPGYWTWRDDDYRAAAVQAAIWFFTDKVALSTTTGLYPGNYPTSVIHDLTVDIVNDARAHGPAQEPQRPVVQVTPSSLAAPATGEIAGPFTVTADGPAIVRSVGVEVFTDQAGTNQLQDGDEVQPGTHLWARVIPGFEEHRFVLDRVVTDPTGTVFLPDAINPDRQELILAVDALLATSGGATLVPFTTGSLRLVKVIRGSAAGLQDSVDITVTCPATGTTPDVTRVLTLPAGTGAGAHAQLVMGLPAGITCTISETSDGSNDSAHLVGTPEVFPSSVTISEDHTANTTVSDTYTTTPMPAPTPTPKPRPRPRPRPRLPVRRPMVPAPPPVLIKPAVPVTG